MPKGNKKRHNKHRKGGSMKGTGAAGSTAVFKNVIPDDVIMFLQYVDTTVLRNNAGGTIISYRFRINDPYDNDPLIASGAPSGYNEMAAMYDRYRVLSVTFIATAVNMEAFPIQFTVVPTLLDLGANSSQTSAFPETRRSKTKTLAGYQGQNKATIKMRFTISALEGNITPKTDQNFSAPVTTNPVSPRYINIGFFSGGNVFVNGVFCESKIIMKTLFTERLNVFASPFPKDPLEQLIISETSKEVLKRGPNGVPIRDKTSSAYIATHWRMVFELFFMGWEQYRKHKNIPNHMSCYMFLIMADILHDYYDTVNHFYLCLDKKDQLAIKSSARQATYIDFQKLFKPENLYQILPEDRTLVPPEHNLLPDILSNHIKLAFYLKMKSLGVDALY